VTKIDKLLDKIEFLKTSIAYFERDPDNKLHRRQAQLMRARLQGIEEALEALDEDNNFLH